MSLVAARAIPFVAAAFGYCCESERRFCTDCSTERSCSTIPAVCSPRPKHFLKPLAREAAASSSDSPRTWFSRSSALVFRTTRATSSRAAGSTAPRRAMNARNGARAGSTPASRSRLSMSPILSPVSARTRHQRRCASTKR